MTKVGDPGISVTARRPAGFKPQFEAVGIFLEAGDKILIVHRQTDRPHPNLWGVPGGGIEPGESKADAAVRELAEETGISLTPQFLFSHYVTFPGERFVFHYFAATLTEPQVTTRNPAEHQDHRWVTLSEALELPLIGGLDAGLRQRYPHLAI